MEELIAAVQTEPALVAWLKTSLWRRSFDRGSLDRAVAFAETAVVRVTGLNHVSGVSLVCNTTASTSIHYIHRPILGFFHTGNDWALRAECSCQVGWYCRHSAAVILLLLEKVAPARPLTPIQHFARSEPVAPPLDPTVQAWLKTIRTAAVSTPTAPKPPKPERRFLAYCLQPLERYHGPQTWYFTLRVGTWLKSGGFTISHSGAVADPSKPPKYMVRDDFVPTSLYYQRKRKIHAWDEMRLEGADWDEILETAFATGRMFVSDPTTDDWQPAIVGPEVEVAATWSILPNGDAVPALQAADDRPRIILPTLPPRYIEPDTGTIGTLAADLSGEILASWITGPRIPAPHVPTIAKELLRVSPDLPPLVEMETVVLPESPPQPHLAIARTNFGGKFGVDVIYANVRFRYNGGKPLRPMEPTEPATHYSVEGSKRFSQKRAVDAERALESRLTAAGFFSIALTVPATLLPLEMKRAKTLSEPDDLDEWLEFLAGQEIAALRDEGWTIEIDPASGLVIRDAGEFFPEIEADPDHGIEWFRFDAKFEVDGRQLSLIPIIAAAIRRDLPSSESPDLPEFYTFPCENPADGSIRFPARRLMEMVDQVRHLFQGHHGDGPLRVDRLGAAGVAAALELDGSETLRALAQLAHNLKNIHALPEAELPTGLHAELRPYQNDGYRWLQFLAANSLHGILADDMGLGKTVQTLAHLAAESAKTPGKPSLVIAPTSVVPNWAAEAEKFTPGLRVLTFHGKDRSADFPLIATSDLVITSYPLVTRDIELLGAIDWHVVVLDEAQYTKNPKSIVARNVCQLRAAHRICLSGTPMENHLGELWSLMRFLMPGFLGDEKSFNSHIRRPIERDRSRDAQLALNRRVSPLILRRTKDQVATELPAKTEIVHAIELTKKQTDLYESVRAAMDKRVRDAISAQGLAKSHIVVLDALLKLRQICCHPQLLKTPIAKKVTESAKLDYLTTELLPTLIEENRRILLFSSFTSMLALIEEHLQRENIAYLKLTGQTQDRATLVKRFQTGEVPVFLISLKAGGTGLNLTAADTVIHYDPWWNPAAENQATDRAHRIGQTKPVFVHKLVCSGTIEERILELQKHKSALVEALLSDETSKLKIDAETLSHLLAPLE